MKQFKYKWAYQDWVIFDPQGVVLTFTLKATRRESIARLLKVYGIRKNWKQYRYLGYRCVKAHIKLGWPE